MPCYEDMGETPTKKVSSREHNKQTEACLIQLNMTQWLEEMRGGWSDINVAESGIKMILFITISL